MPNGRGIRKFEVLPDAEMLARAAAEAWVRSAAVAISTRGRFCVALAGGSTPRRMYEVLASEDFRSRVAWHQVHIFWGDERCVPLDDPRSNCRMARQALMEHVSIPADQIHPIAGAEEPRQAAVLYEAVLKRFFGGGPPRFDLVLLGLGEDGHTASLFPGTPVLREQEKWVADVSPPGQELARVTLTAPVINSAAQVVFLVAGAGKAGVLQEVLEGPSDPFRLPAQFIEPSDGETRWLVDASAAARLGRSSS